MAGFDRLEPLQEKIFAEKLKFQVNYRNFSGVFGKNIFGYFQLTGALAEKFFLKKNKFCIELSLLFCDF